MLKFAPSDKNIAVTCIKTVWHEIYQIIFYSAILSDMIYPYFYINGNILHKDKALIPIYDLGLLRGMGIFDFFRVLDGVAVFAEDHIERLQNSIRNLGMEVDYTPIDWADKFNELIKVNKAERAGFRVVVTGGFSEDGYSIPEQKNVYMMLHELPPNDEQQFQHGVSLITSDYRRDAPTGEDYYLCAIHATAAEDEKGRSV
jgi:D-alanine transaminase/branched-chain amino acid aminotransferase